jgi:hypothetical protein
MRRSEAPFCRTSTLPSLNGNSLALRVADGSVNVRAALVEALRARGHGGGFVHRVRGGLARGQFS